MAFSYLLKTVATFAMTAKNAITNFFLLKEDGFYLLLEDGGKIILEESVLYEYQNKNIS